MYKYVRWRGKKQKIINGMSKSIEDLAGSKKNGAWLVVFNTQYNGNSSFNTDILS